MPFLLMLSSLSVIQSPLGAIRKDQEDLRTDFLDRIGQARRLESSLLLHGFIGGVGAVEIPGSLPTNNARDSGIQGNRKTIAFIFRAAITDTEIED